MKYEQVSRQINPTEQLQNIESLDQKISAFLGRKLILVAEVATVEENESLET